MLVGSAVLILFFRIGCIPCTWVGATTLVCVDIGGNGFEAEALNQLLVLYLLFTEGREATIRFEQPNGSERKCRMELLHAKGWKVVWALFRLQIDRFIVLPVEAVGGVGTMNSPVFHGFVFCRYVFREIFRFSWIIYWYPGLLKPDLKRMATMMKMVNSIILLFSCLYKVTV